MSVINNMLKDLEKRDSHKRDVKFVALSPVYSTKESWLQSKRLSLSITAAIIFLSLTTYLLLPEKSPQQVTAITDEARVISDFNANTHPSTMNWLKPVMITGMTVQSKNNLTEISFLLSHGALYRLTSNAMANHFTLAIVGAEMQAAIPNFNTLDTGIENLISRKVKGDMLFQFALFDGAVVKYVDVNDDDHQAELVVGIDFNKTNYHLNRNQELVKTPAMASLLTQQYQTAIQIAEQGNYQQAINKLNNLINAEPNYRDARVSLAALLIDQNQFDAAQKMIDIGLNLSPGYTPLVELKARLLTNNGKIREALALLLSTAPTITDNPEYYALIAALYARSDNDLLAVKTYKQLLAINPDNGNWWLGLAISFEKLQQLKAAIDAYNKALDKGHLTTDSFAYLQDRLQKLSGAQHAT